MIKVYLAQAMTFLSKKEVYEQDRKASTILRSYGIEVLSPVEKEKVEASDEKLIQQSESEFKKYWKDDKQMIRDAHVLLDISGYSTSEGVRHEIGYARYALFMPIVRIHPKLGLSVARFEDDQIVKTVEEAAQLIVSEYGTRWLRMKWRIRNFIPFKWPKLMFRQFVGMFR
jgi:hypothetical protein